MPRLTRSTVLATALAVSFATAGAPARAAVPTGTGACRLDAVEDPTYEPGWYSGELSGAVLLTEADGVTPATGVLTCRVQVDEWAHDGSGYAVYGHGTGLLTAGPAVVNYEAAEWSNVYVCTEFTDDADGVTYYWDGVSREWSTDVGTECPLASGDDGSSYCDESTRDCIVCPIFAVAFPPEGDVVAPDPVGPIWDCPPYGNVRAAR